MLRNASIYHITSAREAEQAKKSGEYTPAGFEREGFVHCSHLHQVQGVANRLFRGRTDLVLLEIAMDRLDFRVVEENLEGGSELFPHVYGRINMSAVIRIREFPCDAGGLF